MRAPESLISLVDEGVLDEVLRPLMSGKEAQVFLVRSEGELRVAKVYKEAQHRSFKQRAEYTEGRNVRNSRDQRAMTKRTRHGRAQDEAAWRSAEVDMIYRLQAAGVRVPKPFHFVDGVLIMELVTDAEGNPAPRLGDLSWDRDRAVEVFDRVLREVVRMLAAGVVHGDLSDFNVLMGTDGPVIIDFPQAVNASGNQSARKLLLRDVDNLHRFISKVVPTWKSPPYAQEMWQLYERGELTPEVKLGGGYRESRKVALTDDVLSLVAEAERDERRRRESLGLRMRGGTGDAAGMPAAEPSAAAGPPRRQMIEMAPRRPPPPAQRGPRPQHPQGPHARGPQHSRAQPHPQQQQARAPQHPRAQPHPQQQQARAPQHPRGQPHPQQQQARAPQHPRMQPHPQHPHAQPHPQQQQARAPQHPRMQPHPQLQAGALQDGALPAKKKRRRRKRKPPAAIDRNHA